MQSEEDEEDWQDFNKRKQDKPQEEFIEGDYQDIDEDKK